MQFTQQAKQSGLKKTCAGFGVTLKAHTHMSGAYNLGNFGFQGKTKGPKGT